MVTKLTDLFEPISVDKTAAAPPKATPPASGGGGSAKLPAAPAAPAAPAVSPDTLGTRGGPRQPIVAPRLPVTVPTPQVPSPAGAPVSPVAAATSATPARVGTREIQHPGGGIQEEEVTGGGTIQTEHPLEGGGTGLQIEEVTPDQPQSPSPSGRQLPTDPPPPPLSRDQPVADQPPHEPGTMGPENPVNQSDQPVAEPPVQEGTPPTDPNEAPFGVYPEGHPNAGNAIGPHLIRDEVAGMINGDTEIDWNRVANSTRGEHEVEITADLDRQYAEALAKGQGGGQLSPEDLETLAKNRMMKTAMRTSKNPQETIKKYMSDGVYSRAELEEIIADDEDAQKQLAAYGDGAATEPGEKEKPSGLAQWFGDMEPDQRLAMMIGIPLALIGLIGSMTEGGVGNMLTGLLGAGAVAYGMSPGVRGMVQGLPEMIGGLFGGAGSTKSREYPEGWGAVPEEEAGGGVSGEGAPAAPGTRTGVPMPTPDENVTITDENGNPMSVHPSDPRAQQQDMFDPDGIRADDPAIGEGAAAPGVGGPPVAGEDPAAPGQPAGAGKPEAAAPVRHTPKSMWADNDISKEEVELVMNDEALRRQVLFSRDGLKMLRSAVAKGGPFAENVKKLKHVGLTPASLVKPYKIRVLTGRKGSKVIVPNEEGFAIGQGMHPNDANKLYDLAQQI